MRPMFSVVIPTYNRAEKLERTITSILSQTYADLEILVMDDGSTDNTAEVVASLADPRIIYEWDSNFGGAARPRNRGIALAKGEWICFLDADDWWTSDKLQVCFNSISPRVDLIYHDLEIISDQPSLFRRKIIKSWQVKRPVLMDLLLVGNALANSSVIVRKSLLEKIGGIDECREMIAAEDYNTWLRIAQFTNQFIYIPRKLGYYLQHNNNISQKDMSLPYRRAVSDFLGLLSDQEKLKLETNIRYVSARFNYLKGNYRKAKEDLFIVLRYGQAELLFKSLWMIFIMQFSKK